MKRISILLLIFLLFLQPALVFADNWEITSPFGWRFHPVLGGWKYHGGVDIGLEYGVPIPAVQSGTIEYTSYDEGGGNMVLVDHGDGQETIYMHLSAFAVIAGQAITKGQTIGYVGSTGYSTGPHLHIGYYLNGSLADPLPYMISQGWSVTNVPSNILDDLPGFMGPGEMPWDFSGFYDLGKSLDEAISTFTDECKNGLEELKNESIYLLWIFAVIDLSWLAMQHALKGNSITGNIWIIRFLKYGFILYLIVNWTDIVNNVISTFFSIGIVEFFGGTATNADFFSKPGDVLAKGVKLIEPGFTYLSQNSGTAYLNLAVYLTCAALSLLILFFFLLIGIALVIYNVEFYIIAMFAILALPFGLIGGMFSSVKAFPGGVIGSLITSAVKILIAGIVITLIINVLSTMQPVKYEITSYIKILAACFCFLLLLIRIPPSIADKFKGHVNF